MKFKFVSYIALSGLVSISLLASPALGQCPNGRCPGSSGGGWSPSKPPSSGAPDGGGYDPFGGGDPSAGPPGDHGGFNDPGSGGSGGGGGGDFGDDGGDGGSGGGSGNNGLLNNPLFGFLLGFLAGNLTNRATGSKASEQPTQVLTNTTSGNIANPNGLGQGSGQSAADKLLQGQPGHYYLGVSAGEAQANQKSDADYVKNNPIALVSCVEPIIVGECCVLPIPILEQPPKPLVHYFYPMVIYESDINYYSRLVAKDYVSQQRDLVLNMKKNQGANRINDAVKELSGSGGGSSDAQSDITDFQNAVKSADEKALGMMPREDGNFYTTSHAIPALELLKEESRHDLAKKFPYIEPDQFDKLERALNELKGVPPVGFDFANGYEYVIDPDKTLQLNNSKSATNPAEAYREWKNDKLRVAAAEPDRDQNPFREVFAAAGASGLSDIFFPGKNYGLVPLGTSYASDKRTNVAWNSAWQVGAVAGLLPNIKEKYPIYERIPYSFRLGEKVADRVLPITSRYLAANKCWKGPDEPFMQMEEWGNNARVEMDSIGTGAHRFQTYVNFVAAQSCPPGYIVDPMKCPQVPPPYEYYSSFQKSLAAP